MNKKIVNLSETIDFLSDQYGNKMAPGTDPTVRNENHGSAVLPGQVQGTENSASRRQGELAQYFAAV